MSLGGAMDGNLFDTNMSLRCQIRSLKRTIEEYKNGKRYLKIQKDHSRVVKGYIKEIGRLKKELSTAHAQVSFSKLSGAVFVRFFGCSFSPRQCDGQL